MSERPEAAPDSAVIQFERQPDLAAPDLAPPSAALVPVFPLDVNDTRLVLYDGEPGEVRVRWYLRANDYVAAGHDFPSAGGRPAPVLRLLRQCDDGGSDLADESPLSLSGNHGEGESGFSVGPEFARFEAELGLVNREGGWLLLARSNQLETAAASGLALLTPGDDASPPADPTLAPPPTALKQEFPAPDPRVGRPPVSLADVSPLPRLDAPPARALDWVGERLASDSEGIGVPAGFGRPRSEHGVTPARLLAQADAGADSVPPASGQAAASAARIPTLVYGAPTLQCAGLLIEAELHIHGWAAPNTDIDLFGHRYRIGPGGRFQFVLKVDDPALLKQALTLHPPPELGYPRDD